MTTTQTPIFTVTGEFTERGDAQALVELAAELGIVLRLGTKEVNGHWLPIRETRAGKVILTAMRTSPTRTWGLSDVGAALQEGGYKATSSSPLLGKLVDQGDVEKVGPGEYRLTPPKPVVASFTEEEFAELKEMWDALPPGTLRVHQ